MKLKQCLGATQAAFMVIALVMATVFTVQLISHHDAG